MTACESSGYTGASFSITTVFQIRHIIYTVFFGEGRWVVVVDVSNLINNILFLADVKIISSPRQQMLVLAFFGGFDQTQKRGPFSVLFLCVTLICISPHIGKLLRASKGGFWQLDVLEYNAISR